MQNCCKMEMCLKTGDSAKLADTTLFPRSSVWLQPFELRPPLVPHLRKPPIILFLFYAVCSVNCNLRRAGFLLCQAGCQTWTRQEAFNVAFDTSLACTACCWVSTVLLHSCICIIICAEHKAMKKYVWHFVFELDTHSEKTCGGFHRELCAGFSPARYGDFL